MKVLLGLDVRLMGVYCLWVRKMLLFFSDPTWKAMVDKTAHAPDFRGISIYSTIVRAGLPDQTRMTTE